MRQPSNREAKNRSELMCTSCEEEGLEEHPAFKGEYSGRAALIKATRCPNEDCDHHRGMPENDVKIQLPEKNILSNISSLNMNSNLKDMAILTFLFLGAIIFIVTQTGFLSSGDNGNGADDEENGDIVDQDIELDLSGEVVEEYEDLNIELYKENDLIITEDISDEIQATDIESGTYTAYLTSSDDDFTGPEGKNVEIDGEDEEISLEFNEEQELSERSIDQLIDDGSIKLEYNNPSNIEDIDLQLNPVHATGGTTEETVSVEENTPESVLSPVEQESQQLTVDVPVTSERFVDTFRYEGDVDSYEIGGNKEAEYLEITLPEESTAPEEEKTVQVDGQEQETINVNSENTLGPAELTISDGTATDTAVKTEEYEPGELITMDSGLDDYTDGTLQIEPIIEEHDSEYSGVITGETINPNLSGNAPVKESVIRFDGGETSIPTIGEENIDASASDGSKEYEQDLGTASESGVHRLEFDNIDETNEEHVSYWYEINGDRTDIDTPDSETFSLSSGDEVTVGVTVERDTVGDENDPHNTDSDPLEIKEIHVSPSNPNTDEVSDIAATIENTDPSNDITKDISLYINGEEVSTLSNERFDANEERFVDFGRRNIGGSDADEATHTIHVNEKGPKYIELGGSEPEYGSVNLEASLREVGSEGTVNVDTNGDGEFDCEAEAQDGECSLDEIERTEEINVEESGVSETDYTIEYIERTAPTDVSVDIGDDGITDLHHDGRLKSSSSTDVTVPAGEFDINVNTRNDIPIKISQSWESENIIKNPVIDVNGETIVSDEDQISGEETFEVGELPQGENEFFFQSEEGNYKATINWIEDEDASYPTAVINDEEVCTSVEFADDLTCTVDDTGVDIGTHDITFEDTTSDFDYQLEHKAQAVETDVEVNINGDEYTYTTPDPDLTDWREIEPIDSLDRGENDIEITTTEENRGMVPEAEAQLQFAIEIDELEEFEIELVNGKGETNNIEISEDDVDPDTGGLQRSSTVTIPDEYLTVGENRIQISSQDGVVNLQSDILTADDENIVISED